MTRRVIGRPPKVYCLTCEEEIKKTDRKFQVAIDRPIYLNLLLHLKCYKKIDEKTLNNAIKQHIYLSL